MAVRDDWKHPQYIVAERMLGSRWIIRDRAVLRRATGLGAASLEQIHH